METDNFIMTVTEEKDLQEFMLRTERKAAKFRKKLLRITQKAITEIESLQPSSKNQDIVKNDALGIMHYRLESIQDPSTIYNYTN
jgi:hypothetical protein